MALGARLLGLLAFPAQPLDRVSQAVLPFLPRALGASLLVVALLAFVAFRSAEETSATIAARPLPQATSVSALVDDTNAYWVTLDALVSGPHADNGSYLTGVKLYQYTEAEAHDLTGLTYLEHLPPEREEVPGHDGVLRYFYVLRDPADPSAAIMARSVRDADQFRTRTITARVLPSEGDRVPRLVELDSTPAGAPPEGPQRQPSDVSAADDVVVLTGRFSDGQPTECDASGAVACPDGKGYEYTVSDATGGEVKVVSPHAPEALPVRLMGTLNWDPTALEAIYGEQPVETALTGTRHPESWLFEDGDAPVIPDVSYTGAIIPAVLAALMFLSWLAARAKDALAGPPPPEPDW